LEKEWKDIDDLRLDGRELGFWSGKIGKREKVCERPTFSRKDYSGAAEGKKKTQQG